MKAFHVNDWTGEYSFESDFTIGVVSRMGRLRLREITLYAGERTHIGTFRFQRNRIWFQPAPGEARRGTK